MLATTVYHPLANYHKDMLCKNPGGAVIAAIALAPGVSFNPILCQGGNR
jgi:hypothetical protein